MPISLLALFFDNRSMLQAHTQHCHLYRPFHPDSYPSDVRFDRARKIKSNLEPHEYIHVKNSNVHTHTKERKKPSISKRLHRSARRLSYTLNHSITNTSMPCGTRPCRVEPSRATRGAQTRSSPPVQSERGGWGSNRYIWMMTGRYSSVTQGLVENRSAIILTWSQCHWIDERRDECGFPLDRKLRNTDLQNARV